MEYQRRTVFLLQVNLFYSIPSNHIISYQMRSCNFFTSYTSVFILFYFNLIIILFLFYFKSDKNTITGSSRAQSKTHDSFFSLHFSSVSAKVSDEILLHFDILIYFIFVYYIT